MDIDSVDGLVGEIKGISFRGKGIIATVAATTANYPGDEVKGLWLHIDVSESFPGGNKVPRLIYTRRAGLLFYETACVVRDANPAMPDFDIRTTAQKAYAALIGLLRNSGVQLNYTDASGLTSTIIGYSAMGETAL